MTSARAACHTPTSQREAQRLACLHSLGILDSEPDERLDAATAAAARYFGVAMSAVTLIDADCQWLKSKFGTDLTTTPRSAAFCNHTIRASRLLVVENAREDMRFADSPLVKGPPNIRFYAGAPLLIEGRHRIGSFCLFDPKPRELDTETRARLWQFAAMATELIEILHRNNKLKSALRAPGATRRSL